MNPEISRMHDVWNRLVVSQRNRTELPPVNFDEIVSAIFSTGPSYFYVVDFHDLSLSHVSEGFRAAHGIEPLEATHINHVLGLVHRDDMDFVTKAESKAMDMLYKTLGKEKLTRYKASYNFRFRSAKGTYSLYNHQALILTVDENHNFVKALNIHTDISHHTNRNNHTLSLIGLGGEPSFMEIDVMPQKGRDGQHMVGEQIFSPRELEVIRYLAKGHSSLSIANELCISEDTVKTHRKNIKKKSGCNSTAELVVRCMNAGWL